MILLKAKLDGPERKGQLERARVQKWLQEQVQKDPHRLLFGYHGMGKTTELLSFIRNHYKSLYGYYCLDNCDNDVSQFQAYFVAMIKNAGIAIQEHLEGFELHETIERVLKALEDNQQQRILVFDRVDYLKDAQIIQELLFLSKYAGGSCAIIFICDNMVPEEFKQACYEGTISVLSAGKIVFNQEEMSHYLSTMRWHMGKEKIQLIEKYSGGWPGIFCSMEELWQKTKRDTGLESIVLSPVLNEYIYRVIWKYQTEIQQKILIYAGMFPYVNEDFFTEIIQVSVREDELLWLVRSGIMIYENNSGYYYMVEMLKPFMQKIAEREGFLGAEEITKAAYWYDTHQAIKEAILCLKMLEDKKELAAYLVMHVKEIALGLQTEELRQCLLYVHGICAYSEELFLQGILELREEKYDRVKLLEQKLVERYYEVEDTQKNRICELLLNLFYLDPLISAKDWLDWAETYLAGQGTVQLYTLVSGGMSLCCGGKHLASFFVEGVKQQRIYKRRWQAVVCEEQAGCFDVAEIEYLLETNREKQALEKLQDILTYTQNLSDPNQLIGIFEIMCKLYRKGLNDNIYDDTMQFLTLQLKNLYSQWMGQNMRACRIYYEAWRGSRDQLAYWIQNDSLSGDEHIVYENVYICMLKGVGLLNLHQYAKAYALLEKVSLFYRNKNKPLYLMKSQFGEAVALYGLNRQTEALKLATQALTMGVKYRYVGIYTEFGKIGYDLIQLYQHMIEGGEKKRSGNKKKYYYGNILRASYEEYQTILLRSAKKEAKRYALEDGTEKEHLTTTELLILKEVSNGMTNQEIATAMNIKQTTVKTHLYAIYRKLNVKSRVAAVNKAKESGIL
ncbi:MAG: LuxR C-terminal-related transcriptional regulator [Lachnospiraceae bacterium]|nr:LuxR C-terminal-related transcriptional regulator [Lachnospiraceae bacterium]